MGNLAGALAAAATQHGVEVRTNASVEHVIVENGRAMGVVLTNGDEIRATTVVSNADPRRTFSFVHPSHLTSEFTRAIRNVRLKGTCAKVHLALGELPQFSGATENGSYLNGTISISPSLQYLERAFDDAKYGSVSSKPYLEAVIPSERRAGVSIVAHVDAPALEPGPDAFGDPRSFVVAELGDQCDPADGLFASLGQFHRTDSSM